MALYFNYTTGKQIGIKVYNVPRDLSENDPQRLLLLYWLLLLGIDIVVQREV